MPRNKAIDILRGLGILAIIFIHVTAWFTFDKTAHFIWNWGQFAVPAFVFCSTYLFFGKKEKYEKEGWFNYSVSRLKRLVYPYWVFLAFYYLIYLLKKPQTIHWEEVVRSITLTSPGQEINWAILLFVYMNLLLFPLLILWRKNKFLFGLYGLAALSFSSWLIFNNWPFNFRLIMWLPWSLVILFSWYFARYQTRKFFYPLTLIGTFLLFLILFLFQKATGSSDLFIADKYPPGLYFLSYGMFSSALIYYAADKGLFDLIHKPIHFLSTTSYNIFFIHLWLIIAFSEFMNIRVFAWWQFLLLILTLTIGVQLVIYNRLAWKEKNRLYPKSIS